MSKYALKLRTFELHSRTTVDNEYPNFKVTILLENIAVAAIVHDCQK